MTGFITPAFAQDTAAPQAEAPAPAAGSEAGSAGHGAHPAAGTPLEGTKTEVTHDAGGHEGGFPPFDPTYFASQLFWLVISFALLYGVIARIAAPRIGSILEDRQGRVAADLGEAERMRGETEAAIAAYEQSLAEAKKRAGGIASQTREALAKDLDSRRHAIEANLSAELARAEAHIATIKAKAMVEVDGIAAEITDAIVAALLGKSAPADAAAAVAAIRKASGEGGHA